MKNPKWDIDELILALDLYFCQSPLHISKQHPKVIELSQILNRLPIHDKEAGDIENFRSPNAVYMKMCNYLAIDPEYQGTGLERGSMSDQLVWDRYARDKATLHLQAIAIRKGASLPGADNEVSNENEEEAVFPEGKILYRLHRARERNSNLIRKKKESFKESNERLFCEACGFDFEQAYGDIGQDYIECHHIRPLSDLAGRIQSRMSDLVLVCSNCHRMIHRKRPWLSLETIKGLISA